MTNDELIAKVLELEKTIDDMKASYSFPKDVMDAIKKRLGFGLIASGTTTLNAATNYGSFPVTVPAAASGALTVSFNGTTYNLLYK